VTILKIKTKKKVFVITIISFLLVLFSQITIAEVQNVKLIDNWFDDLDSVNVNDNVYKIDVANSKLLFKRNLDYVLLDLGECDNIDDLVICFIAYDKPNDVERAKVQVFLKSASFEILRTIDDSDLFIGDESRVQIVITNDGNKDAESLTYNELVPDNFEIISKSDDLILNGNRITWSGDLAKSKTKTLFYNVVAIDSGEISYLGKIDYGDLRFNSNSLSVGIDHPIDVLLYEKVNDYTRYVDEEFQVASKITNKKDSNLKINKIEYIIPYNFDVKYDPSTTTKTFSGTNNIYSTKSLLLDEDEYIFQNFTFVGAKNGKPNIILSVDYTSENIDGDVEVSKEFIISIRDLVVKSGVLKDSLYDEDANSSYLIDLDSNTDKLIEIGQNGRFVAYLENPYSKIDLKDIKVTINSSVLEDSTFWYPYIDEQGIIKIIDLNIINNKTYTSSSDNVIINIDYFTEFGYNYSQEYKTRVKVVSVGDVLITHSLSPSSVEGNDDVDVSVYAENKRKSKLTNVQLKEYISPELSVTGITSRKTELSEGEKELVYTYTIKVPYSGNDLNYYLNTSISYESPQGMESDDESYKFVAKNPTLTLDVDKTYASTYAIVGKPFPISYSISNEESIPLYNLIINFPKIEGVMYYNSYYHSIDKILAGETILEKSVEYLIFNESEEDVDIKKSKITFYDKFNNEFYSNSDDFDFDVDEGDFDMPFIDLSREIKSLTTSDYYVNTTLIVKNTGTRSVNFKLYDDDSNLLIDDYINTKTQKNYSSIIEQKIESGYQTIKPARVKITWDDNDYYALSDEYSVKFLSKLSSKVKLDENLINNSDTDNKNTSIINQSETNNKSDSSSEVDASELDPEEMGDDNGAKSIIDDAEYNKKEDSGNYSMSDDYKDILSKSEVKNEKTGFFDFIINIFKSILGN
jgi:hypothetical protein